MKIADHIEAENRLNDSLWRLNNLYWIIDKAGNESLFTLNWAQKKLYQDMWYCNLILKARQLGISNFVCLLFLDRCLFNSNQHAGIIAHTREDAEVMFRRVKVAYDCLPPELKALRSVNTDNARELHLSNGSTLRVGTSMRSSTLQYLHISEFGKVCAKFPDKAREIITGSLNALAPNQYVFIESTAEGREGYFYQMCKEAQVNHDAGKKLSPLDFRFHFFPWWQHTSYSIASDNITIPNQLTDYFNAVEVKIGADLDDQQRAWYCKRAATQGEDMKREFPSTPEEAFESSNEGLYYGRQLIEARQKRRINKVYYDPNVSVNTAWDLGYNDSTTIWFFQQCGQEIHLLEYYENSGETLTHYLHQLKSKSYTYGKHLVPHDAAVHEYSTGLSRVEVARNHGVNFTVVPDIVINEGIDAARNMIPRCWLDEEKCAKGIASLDNYKKEWNDRHGCWSSLPLHNFASHGADAFRILAVGIGKLTKGLSAEEWRGLRAQYVV
ncbi:MAG: terminase [Parachlamydiaceae bacterium]|nr:terminase [Parachlamydiaceae bacterium]